MPTGGRVEPRSPSRRGINTRSARLATHLGWLIPHMKVATSAFGTFRTCRDGCLESVMRSKADIRQVLLTYSYYKAGETRQTIMVFFSCVIGLTRSSRECPGGDVAYR